MLTIPRRCTTVGSIGRIYHCSRPRTQWTGLGIRGVSTLPDNPHLYVFPDPQSPSSHLLTLLPTDPPTPSIAVGTTTKIPPAPSTLKENPKFLNIMHSVIAQYACQDPGVQGQAATMASTSGAGLMMTGNRQSTGSAGASGQAGSGGAGRGGWVHVSDLRHPPDFGRIAEPEDIFGSVEVDSAGNFVDGHGRYQESGTYRVCTKEGVLGLSDFLRQKLVERLKVEESAVKNSS